MLADSSAVYVCGMMMCRQTLLHASMHVLKAEMGHN